ncbi:MAG: Asp-tRNA(Asn)/Glu-tRNA(Gln) amidotransferase GatCAB subunit B, partial [Candidatus Omnitrophica bacterium]|nr:Asp-tRNA(Asn)/Glu-tRNA(Gln) amidotransferase GatCAB subunit B [Candidatus Omnitrophota bacterium]
PMRTKEEAHDYRYFPEPDLMPIVFSREEQDRIRKSLPEMPQQRLGRFTKDYKLSDYDASVLTSEKKKADFFEITVKDFNQDPKTVANWVTGDLAAALSAANLSFKAIPLKEVDFADMLDMIKTGKISGKMAKEILRESIETQKRPKEIVKDKGLSQITDEKAIKDIIKKVLALNSKAVEDYSAGKESALAFLVGQVMKETKGKASPSAVNKLLKDALKKERE